MVSFVDHYSGISTDRLLSKTKIEKVSWYFNNSFLCKPEFSSATMTFLFLIKKTKKTSTLQQVTGENTPNFVLIRMLRYFLKSPPLKKILQCQDRICFFLLKTQKTTTLQQVRVGIYQI